MTTMVQHIATKGTPRQAQRLCSTARDEALLRCACRELTMLHFVVAPEVLRPLSPFALDLHHGRAYVSLVTLRLDGLSVNTGRRWVDLPTGGENRFACLRTYVRHQDEAGVHPLRQWLSAPLLRMLGPRHFGFPVEAGPPTLPSLESKTQTGTQGDGRPLPGALDAFLLDRHAVLSMDNGVARRVRVRHEPWAGRRINAHLRDAALLRSTVDWFDHATQVAAHGGEDVEEVWIDPPQCVNGPACSTRWAERI